MKCYKCKREIEYTAKFCPYCGSEQGFADDLIKKAIQGDQGAQTELYNRTYNDVYHTIFMLVKDEDTVFDLVQDTYIIAFEKLFQLNRYDSFRPWVKKIARNRTLNVLKRKKPTVFSDVISMESDQAVEIKDEREENLPDVVIDRQETSRLLGEILDFLSEEQRVVIGMYYYDQMSVKEIAAECDCSENTVKSRLSYARKKIEEKVRNLEKQGTKLYGLSPIPFLLLLLRNMSRQPVEIPKFDISRALPRNASSASPGNTAQVVPGKDALGKTVSGTGLKTAATLSSGKIAAVIGACVVTVLGGVGIYTSIRTERPVSNEAVQEARRDETEPVETTESETESELPVETETQAESEMILQTESEVARQTETETEYDAANFLADAGFEYIGNTSYPVTYTSAMTEGNVGGLDIQIPLGIISCEQADFDGDGEDELLLVQLEKGLSQYWPLQGKEEGYINLIFCENRDGKWKISQQLRQEEMKSANVGTFLPNCGIHISQQTDGCHVFATWSNWPAFIADPSYVKDIAEYSYQENKISWESGIEDAFLVDGDKTYNILTDRLDQSESYLLCRVVIPEVYDNTDEETQRGIWNELNQQGQPLSVTLLYEDNARHGLAADNGDAQTETTPEATEIASAQNSEPDEAAYMNAVQEVFDEYRSAFDDASTDVVELSQKYPKINTLYFQYKAYGRDISSMSYTFYDVDKNGVDELLLQGGTGPDIFAFDGTEMQPIFKAGYRASLSIFEDGTIMDYSSSGAARAFATFYRIAEDGKTLETVRKIYNIHGDEKTAIQAAEEYDMDLEMEGCETMYDDELDALVAQYTGASIGGWKTLE